MAGIKRLVGSGVIEPEATVVAVLTGHLLKDTDYVIDYHQERLVATDSDGREQRITGNFANHPVRVEAKTDAIMEALRRLRKV